MRILILNQDWFAEEFRALGHEVVTAGLWFAEHLEHKLSMPFIHIDRVIDECMGGVRPDRILVHDNSAPIAFSGLDETPIPTLFYSVDTHHHASLHRYLYEIFDHTLVAQKDYITHFNEWQQTPEWFPLWASRPVDVSGEKKHGAVFVGTLSKDLNPDRVKFFAELEKRVPVLCTTGFYWDIFPFSEIVINQTVKGDLNFRVFEAMMCGAMLLTERSGNGLFDLFEDEKHIVTYEKGNVEEAAQKIQYFLEHPDDMRKIAHAGREEILKRHTPMERAKKMLSILEGIEKKQSKSKFFSMMVNHVCVARSNKNIDTGSRVIALTSALKSAEHALQYNEPIDNQMACHLILAVCDYEKYMQNGRGNELLNRIRAVYPHEHILQLAAIREALNRGHREFAQTIIESIGLTDISGTFEKAEIVIRSLLEAT